MDLISYDDLSRLAAADESAHVSVFAPMQVRAPQTAQNPIRWVNQLRRAERALRADGLPVEQIDALVGPGYLLADDRMFWEHQRGGLAYYAAPGWTTWFRVPVELPELVAVGSRFVVGPLLEVLAAGGRFWVLTLSQRQVRLFEASRFTIDEVPAAELPAAAPARGPRRAGRERPDAFVAARGGAGSGGTVYFGRGTSPEQLRTAETARYFREVDAVLRARAAGTVAPPLLLAGDSPLLSLYRQASSYPALLDVALSGNAAEHPSETLHALAWMQLESELRAEESAAAAAYRRRAGTGRTAAEPDQVLEAALQGRVDTLLVSTAAFGSAPTADAAVLRVGAEPPSVADQLDRAAAACLAHGGTVHAVAPERMPGAGPAAALLRY
jgi:hypothetical protein